MLRLLLLAFCCCVLLKVQAQPQQEIGWPRQLTKDGNAITYYQPQVESWKDYKTLVANAAFALTPKGGKETMGVATIEAETNTDKTDRIVYIRNIKYTSVRFPSIEDDHQRAAMEKVFRDIMPTQGDQISLDRLTTQMNDKANPNTPTVQVKNDPPPVFFSQTPAILLIVDGKPVLSPIEKNSMEFVVNTNWDLFYDKSHKQYYLLTENVWLTAADFKGPWTATTSLPKDMSKLPAGQNFDDVKKAIPPKGGTAPYVFFSDKPAELILIKGAPVYSKIKGTNLLYVTNTDNDVFVDNDKELFYVLLSGRWFSANNFEGPWQYAGDKLPSDFKSIPANSPKAHVLASVPGTIEASDAVMLAQIPTTAIINKAEAEKQVKVTYTGDPQFAPIETTSLEYATNTQDKVIKDGDLYYLCFQGVWFMSTSPKGPWKVADNVDPTIYTIPPSSPVYNVTYVTQTNATPTTVESSTTAGYFGMFVVGLVTGMVINYGTGWYYPPFMYWGPMYPYPIYHPWPCTYGAGVVYNPWTGGFAAGRRAYGPYGAAGTSAWYNPATGRYGRSASVQGWYGGRTSASSYNPWTGGYAHTNQGHNAYGQWGHSTAAVGNHWVQTGHVTTAGGTAVGYRTAGGNSGVITTGNRGNHVVHTNNGNVFAGHDGNVYRKNTNGSWSQYTKDGGWNQVQHNGNATHTNPGRIGGNEGTQHVMQGLDRSAAQRNRGEFQTRQFQQFQRSGGLGGARGGFGGGHGGGFRRR